MDDDLDPKDKDLEEDEEEGSDDFDDELILGNKKSKKSGAEPVESLDELAEEEDGALPEDSFDDQDLW